MRQYPLSAALAIAMVGPAMGQIMGDPSAPTTAGLTPVDQAVADQDPLARSQRRVESGHRVDGEQTSLFVLREPVDLSQTPTYIRVGPGFRARLKRLDYVTLDKDDPGTVKRPNFAVNKAPRVDGEFLELVAPDTVYELTLPDQSPFIEAPIAKPLPLVDGRLAPLGDPRVGNRVSTLLDGRVQGPLQQNASHADQTLSLPLDQITSQPLPPRPRYKPTATDQPAPESTQAQPQGDSEPDAAPTNVD